jgi:tRNA1Val (adenine37-N6)-methyltransferase
MPNTYFHFKKFTIRQDKTAMKVGTDGILLGAFASMIRGGHILDIGTGTGLLALMLAQFNPSARIDAIDIDLGAIGQAGENFGASRWKHILKPVHSSLQEFCKKCVKKYDLIVTNPPFFSFSKLSADEIKNLARHTHSLDHGTLLKGVSGLLNPTGCFFLILPYDLKNQTLKTALTHGLYCNKTVDIKPYDQAMFNRTIMVFEKESKSLETSVLCLYLGLNQYTSEARDLLMPFLLDL